MNFLKRPNFLDKIAKDKLLHFAIGVIAYLVFFIFMSPIFALILTIIIGIFIEEYQRKTKTGQYEIADILAVFYGGLAPFIGGILKFLYLTNF